MLFPSNFGTVVLLLRGGGGGAGLGLTRTEMWGGRWWTTAERRCVGSEIRQTTPATTSTTPAHQLLGAANAQTAPAATSTAPAHQRRQTQEQHQQEHRPQQPTQTAATRRSM